MQTYRINAVYSDETGRHMISNAVHVESWDELQKTIKELRESGCYEITEEYIPDGNETSVDYKNLKRSPEYMHAYATECIKKLSELMSPDEFKKFEKEVIEKAQRESVAT